MHFLETKLKGAYIIEPDLLQDERGFFARCFCKDDFERVGLCGEFVQHSISFNKNRGTLRGMHYQQAPNEEIKLIRCTMGAIYDVIVDLRIESDTYRQWVSVELTSQNRRMLYVPQNFAHGFLTLEDNCEVFYQISQAYVESSANGVRWNDQILNIQWTINPMFISERDKSFPLLTPLLHKVKT